MGTVVFCYHGELDTPLNRYPTLILVELKSCLDTRPWAGQG